MTETRMADTIKLDNIVFARNPHVREDKAIVTYSGSLGELNFNAKMVRLLNMQSWLHVLVGYDKASNTIVLKEVPGEEYGSVSVKTQKKTMSENRHVRIRHLVCAQGLKPVKMYRAEREGMMIFLQPATN